MTDPRPRGRPRSAQADARLLEAASALAVERGWDVVGMEDVAGRAGVSKTTLYRRYPDKAALTAALVEHVLAAVPEVDGPGRTPLRTLLEVAARYYGGPSGQAALALLPALRRDPGRALAVRLAAPRVVAEQARLLAADPDADAEALLNLALGAVVFHVLRHGRAPDAALLDRWARALGAPAG